MRYLSALFSLTICAAQGILPAVPFNKVAVDAAGSVYAAQGSTVAKVNQWSATVPFTVLALQVNGAGAVVAAGAGGMVQLDAGSGRILSSGSFTVPANTTPLYMAITPAGNIVISGNVSSAAATPATVNFSCCGGFLMKLDPTGKVLWSGSGIEGALAVDSGENVYVAGSTVFGERIPTTANAFQKTVGNALCEPNIGSALGDEPCPEQYIAKVSADGTKILFATYLTGTLGAAPADIAVGPDGSVYTTGSVQSIDYPVTAGAVVRANPAQFVNTLNEFRVEEYPTSGFVSRLSSDGAMLLYSTYLGGSQRDLPAAIAVGMDGGIVVAGQSTSPNFPGLPQQLINCQPGFSLLSEKDRNFLVELSADGTQIVDSQLIGGTNAGAGISCITDAADGSFADTVSPGELITINGFGAGPAVSEVPGIGDATAQIGGVSVMFDGVSAPLTSAGGTIVTAAVPFAVAGKQQTTMTLLHNGQVFDSRTLGVAAMTPSLFVFPANGKACDAAPAFPFGSFQGGFPTPAPMIQNADGSLNACDNPAAQGSVVTLFMNGLGVGTPVVTLNGGGSVVSALGSEAAVSAVSFTAAGANPIFLTVTAGGQVIGDYQNYGGVPVYVK
jgi:uncharacterized protein (TIGR03437 family)